MKPRIMLLDEPTSAMDAEMGEVIEVMRELAQSRMTVMAVTHEMGFAREAADRIVFFDEGQIVEDSPPEEFLRNPRHSRAKRFLEKYSSIQSKLKWQDRGDASLLWRPGR